MKRSKAQFLLVFLLSLIAVLGSIRVSAQTGAPISGQAITPQGTPSNHAQLTVCPWNSSGTPCFPQSTIYSDAALTHPLTQPYSTDQYGNYSFWVANDAAYLVQIKVGQTLVYSYYKTVGSGGNTGVTQIIAGANITISPTSGLGAVTINATVSSSCGAVAGDNTSTNCGFNNRVPDSATIPANISTFGSSLLDNNLYGNNVAVGVNSGNTHGIIFPGAAWSNAVLIGNALANGHDAAGTDLVDIGMTNGAFIDPFSATYQSDAYDASTITLGFGNIIGTDPQTNACNPTSMIVMGHANLNQCTGNSLLASIVMGESNLFEPVPLTNTQQLNRSVVLGNYNLYQLPATATVNDSFLVGTHVADYYQTLANVFAFGYKAFQQQTASTWSLQNAIAIGEFAGQGVPNNSSELVLLGDGAGNITPNQATPLTDAIMIGDLTGEGNVGHDKVAIGHNAMGTIGFGFNSGNELIAIGDAALLCGTTGTENIAIGHLAGSIGAVPGSFTCANSNHTGSNNVWIGTRAGPNTTSQLSNTVALGYQAFNTASNQTVIGNSSMTQLIAYGTGDGCLSSLSGVITGSGLACGSGGGSGVQYNPTTTVYFATTFSGAYDDADANSRSLGVPSSVSCVHTTTSTCTVTFGTAHGLAVGGAIDMSNLATWPASPLAGGVQQAAQYGSFQVTTVPSSTQITFTTPTSLTYTCSPCTGNAYDASLWGIWQFAKQPYIYGHGTVYGVETTTQSAAAQLATWIATISGTPLFLVDQTGQNDFAAGRTVAQVEADHQTLWAAAHTAGMTVIETTMVPAQYGLTGVDIKPGQFNYWLWEQAQGKTATTAANGQYIDKYVDTATALLKADTTATMPNPSVNLVWAQAVNKVFGIQGGDPIQPPSNFTYSSSGLFSDVVSHYFGGAETFYDQAWGNWMVWGSNTGGTTGIDINSNSANQSSVIRSWAPWLTAGNTWYGNCVGRDLGNSNVFCWGFHYVANNSTSNYASFSPSPGGLDALRLFAGGAIQTPHFLSGYLQVDGSGNWSVGPGGAAFANGLGTGYQDATEIAAPANPSAGIDRLYTDSTTHQLSCLTSAGANCMPTGSGPGAATYITADGTGTPPTNYQALTAGPNITLTPNAGAHTMTIAASGGGSGNYVNLGGSVVWTGCTYASGVCTTTGGVSSIDIASIPSTYLHLKISIQGAASSGGAIAITCQLNGDTGSNYGSQYVQASFTTVSANQTTIGSGVVCGTLGDSSALGWDEITVPYYSTSQTYHLLQNQISQLNGALTSGTMFTEKMDFWWKAAAPAAVNEIKINGTTIGTGAKVTIYGMN